MLLKLQKSAEVMELLATDEYPRPHVTTANIEQQKIF
jgi:hypothetical protein